MNMKKKILCTLISMLSTLTVIHAEFNNDPWEDTLIDLYGGYRADSLSTLVKVDGADHKFLLSDHIKAKRLSIWEVGVKGRISYCHWYLRGFGSYGWNNSGRFTEKVVDTKGEVNHQKADIQNGRTLDGLIGIGYMYRYNRCWGFGPVAGWSYDRQKVTTHHGQSAGQPAPSFDHLIYKMQWNGPWVGVDIIYSECELTIFGGYEYHWAHWKANWNLQEKDSICAFADTRTSNHVNANVLYLDAIWTFCSNWNIGIGLKFQEWTARRGTIDAASGIKPFQEEHDHVKHAKWYSGAINGNIGYTF